MLEAAEKMKTPIPHCIYSNVEETLSSEGFIRLFWKGMTNILQYFLKTRSSQLMRVRIYEMLWKRKENYG